MLLELSLATVLCFLNADIIKRDTIQFLMGTEEQFVNCSC
jgi:hypothetical protein